MNVDHSEPDSLQKSTRRDSRQFEINQAFISRPICQPLPEQAIHLFLSDTILNVNADSKSNGHFANLPALFHSSSQEDALPFALEAVALASLANRFCSPNIRVQATRQYICAISRLRNTDLTSKERALKSLASAVLLSLYEITNANANSESYWLRHLKGIVSIIEYFVERNEIADLGIAYLLLGFDRRLSNSGKYTSSHLDTIVSQPTLPHFSDLCSILPKVQILFKNAAVMFDPNAVLYESTLKELRQEAISLKSELVAWGSVQPETSRPKTIERFTQHYILRFPGAEDLVCPTTRADTYCDYFVACTWQSYRQCQLHLTNLLTRINRALHKNPQAYNTSREYQKSLKDIRGFVDDICASMAFMLVGESIHGNKPQGSIWAQGRPPRLLGGLSLQWLLFTVSILETVDMAVKQNMNASLLWIGKNLGIGQATVLAQMDQNLPGGVTAKGDALKWAGFLI